MAKGIRGNKFQKLNAALSQGKSKTGRDPSRLPVLA